MNELEKLTVGSLFSGIGGLELGLERTGGFRTIWNSEIDLYASAVLRKHWPEVPNLGDITKIEWSTVERPDLICGGFPCQDISTAGKGAGIKEGTRSGLWFEFHKAIRVLRPKYALVENVSALSFRGLCIVLGDLAEIGYDAEWFTLQARDVGAPHKRERLFIVAYPRCERRVEPELKEFANRGGKPPLGDFTKSVNASDPSRGGRDDRENYREGGQVPHAQERDDAESNEERNRREPRPIENLNADSADSERVGCGGRLSERGGAEREFLGGSEGNGNSVRGETQRRDLFQKGSIQFAESNDDGLEGFVTEKVRRFPEFQNWENLRCVEDLAGRSDIPEPLIRGGDNGVPHWVDRIKCLGNAVVPQVAQVIGEAILQNERGRA